MWTEARDVSAMQKALSGIINAYERDFTKHPNISEFPVCRWLPAMTCLLLRFSLKKLFPDQVKLRVRFLLDNLKLDDKNNMSILIEHRLGSDCSWIRKRQYF